jgi:hypothetical protein
MTENWAIVYINNNNKVFNLQYEEDLVLFSPSTRVIPATHCTPGHIQQKKAQEVIQNSWMAENNDDRQISIQ